MNAKLIVEGKEFNIEILDPELQKLIAPPEKKTGYERVNKFERYWYTDTLSVEIAVEEGDDVDLEFYDAVNYYSDKTIAENNTRADKLMRQLRRFAAEHREKELKWDKEGLCTKKYCICYRYDEKRLICPHDSHVRVPFMPYFDSEATARLAIDTFYDELIWYFTEYKDSL